jgi:flagellar export protein FliJ
MPKFQFRLQKVLEYRETQEEEAKQAFLAARATRIQGEREVEAVQARREATLREPTTSLDAHLLVERLLARLDEEEAMARSAVAVLESEEDAALGFWHERRRETQAIAKLREHAKAQWQLEEDRREQAELDEWATMRRAA